MIIFYTRLKGSVNIFRNGNTTDTGESPQAEDSRKIIGEEVTGALFLNWETKKRSAQIILNNGRTE
jgi:hypothetical protein